MEVLRCECGCGKPVEPPSRWVRGHAGLAKIRKSWGPHWYTIVDMGYETPCFIWDGYKKSTGYGVTRWQGKTVGAHIRAWIESGRMKTPGLTIDHLCRQRACVNVDHMQEVTHTENMRRAISTKLTLEQVEEIRARYTGEYGQQSQLAREFGVRTGTIRFILSGYTWKSSGSA